MGNQLDEGFNEAPQPTDSHATAAMTDIVLIAIRNIELLIKTICNSKNIAIPSILLCSLSEISVHLSPSMQTRV